jgi:predicted nucleotidyltransferase
MESSLAQQRTEIAELCRRYRVFRLESFGSAVGDDFDPQRSDADFLVEFEPLAEGEHADAYFGLRESLEAVSKPSGRRGQAPFAPKTTQMEPVPDGFETAS